jgi:hypothetical protein
VLLLLVGLLVAIALTSVGAKGEQAKVYDAFPVVTEDDARHLWRNLDPVASTIADDPSGRCIGASDPEEFRADTLPLPAAEAAEIDALLPGPFPGLGERDHQPLMDRRDQSLFHGRKFLDEHAESSTIVVKVFPEARETRKPV